MREDSHELLKIILRIRMSPAALLSSLHYSGIVILKRDKDIEENEIHSQNFKINELVHPELLE